MEKIKARNDTGCIKLSIRNRDRNDGKLNIGSSATTREIARPMTDTTGSKKLFDFISSFQPNFLPLLAQSQTYFTKSTIFNSA